MSSSFIGRNTAAHARIPSFRQALRLRPQILYGASVSAEAGNDTPPGMRSWPVLIVALAAIYEPRDDSGRVNGP